MKEELKFYESRALYNFSIILDWSLCSVILFIFIISHSLSDPYGWFALFLVYGQAIFLTIFLYPRAMSKIYINQEGIRKSLFNKYLVRFIKWQDIKDVQILTRPNGYSYVIVADTIIKEKKFEEILKSKTYIYFTYNQKALDYINGMLEKPNLNI